MSQLEESSPVFKFLTAKENLSAVLEVAHYAKDIRDHVANRFWNRLLDAIKKNPKALSASFSWEPFLSDKADKEFGIVARPLNVSDKNQRLNYRIEAHKEYFGMGLCWNQTANEFERLCQLEPVNALLAELKKRSDVEADEPNSGWGWWEYWQRNPFVDPWSWFGEHIENDSLFNDSAGKFWDFVLPTHTLVLEANKTLSRGR